MHGEKLTTSLLQLSSRRWSPFLDLTHNILIPFSELIHIIKLWVKFNFNGNESTERFKTLNKEMCVRGFVSFLDDLTSAVVSINRPSQSWCNIILYFPSSFFYSKTCVMFCALPFQITSVSYFHYIIYVEDVITGLTLVETLCNFTRFKIYNYLNNHILV